VERICNAGYRMVLDPETVIEHQYGGTFASFLKRTFNYGRGGALLFKKKTRDRLARWNMTTLVLFLVWLAISVSLAVLSVTVSTVFLVPLVLIPVVPFVLLTLFYLRRGLKEGDLVVALTYPLMDVLRLIAYCAGELYGIVE